MSCLVISQECCLLTHLSPALGGVPEEGAGSFPSGFRAFSFFGQNSVGSECVVGMVKGVPGMSVPECLRGGLHGCLHVYCRKVWACAAEGG